MRLIPVQLKVNGSDIIYKTSTHLSSISSVGQVNDKIGQSNGMTKMYILSEKVNRFYKLILRILI